jgi:plasmid stabilization system protein ParE
MTLLWSPESIHELLALRAHIAEHDPAAAKRVALHILYCVEYLLSENPKIGAPGRVPGTRELVIPKTPYIVPYRVRGTKIELLASTTPHAAGPTACSITLRTASRRATNPSPGTPLNLPKFVT